MLGLIARSLEPGLVHIRNCLSLSEQIKLSDLALEGNPFWDPDGTLNCTENRGRVFDAITAFPPEFHTTSERVLGLARDADATLPFISPTHLILLYYKTLSEGPHIRWHQDNGDNDGRGSYPVVSLSIGDSCDFLVCHEKPRISQGVSLADPTNLAYRVTLQSGDALVFGGDCRYIWHAIYDMHPGTAPKELPFQGARLNFTFRHAPEILGQEEEFARIDPESVGRDSQFFKLSKMK